MATAADKQALWDAYLAASANQDKAEHAKYVAEQAYQAADQHMVEMEERADDAYAAWERA